MQTCKIWIILTIYLALAAPLSAQDKAAGPTRTEKMLISILKSAPSGIGVVENRVIVQVNDYILDLTGYTREELIGNHARMFYPSDEESEFVGREKYRQIAEKGTGSVETRWMRKDGAIRNVILSSTPLDPNDLPAGVIFTVLDITARKQAEAKLIKHTRFFLITLTAIIFLLLIMVALLIVSLRQRKKSAAALRESEVRLDLAMTVKNEGIWDWNLVTDETYFDDRYYTMAGYSPEEFPMNYEAFAKHVHPDDLKNATSAIQAYLKGESLIFDIEFRFRHKNGYWMWINGKGKIVQRDAKGSPLRMLGTHTDITERKNAEEALLAKTEELNRYFTSSLDLLCIGDTDGHFLRLNPEWEKVLGYTIQDLEGKLFLDLVHADDMEKTLTAISNLSAQQQVLNFANRYRCKDGSYRWIEWRSRPQGDLIYAAARDITARIEAEEKLHSAHEKLLTVLDSIDATIYVADMKTYEILFMNRHIIETFGRDMTGETCYQAFRQEIRPCIFCTNDQLLDGDGNATGVHAWQGKNPIIGKIYSNYDRAIEWIDGRMVRLQIAIDITEQTKMQEQLRQAQKMEAIGTLAGGIAHDFNNMLTVILGYTQSGLNEMDSSHPLHDKLRKIHNAATRSADITSQLLAFARKQTIAPKRLDLNHSMEGMLSMLHRLIGENIDLSWKPAANLWSVRMDPSQLDQILANLCVNARDAITGVGHITIETGMVSFDRAYCIAHVDCTPGDFVLLTVTDDGRGMKKEILENLFEPFFTTKEVGKGTGLGLSTVYGIVRQNNGFISVYSEPNQGTTFKIYLPRCMAKDKEEPAVRPSEEKIPRGHETILLVEDEPMILEMAAEMLGHQGYKVFSAGKPHEAIRIAAEYAGQIDLLITDVVLPEMNGRDLAGELILLYPDIKLLFMSGYTANAISHQGVLEDGVQFLQKPFAMKNLAAKVRDVLDNTKAPNPQE